MGKKERGREKKTVLCVCVCGGREGDRDKSHRKREKGNVRESNKDRGGRERRKGSESA